MNIIVWYRNDLRIHDHPALAAAVRDGDIVIPVFILNSALLKSEDAGSNRNRFLIESLEDLKNSLKEAGADLLIRNGEPAEVLVKLAEVTQAQAVYYTMDYSPYAVTRDKKVAEALKTHKIHVKSFSGRLTIDDLSAIRTKAGTVHKVFTPFWRAWSAALRRPIADTPSKIPFTTGLDIGQIPTLQSVTKTEDLSPSALKGGEKAGRAKLVEWLSEGIDKYDLLHNDMAADATSHISPYLHFGCLSVREIETLLPENEGAKAWHRQLAWRDFYNYVLFYNPQNAGNEFQEKYRDINWSQDPEDLKKWQLGMTGYPIVDAAMRQLKQTGWMHNRARLIVGSFLTKDLWLDWRLGEQYFMRMLVDGDKANNNGNWQWIASVGVDPAPVYRRLYNPASQAKNYDPGGAYIRRYVPELKNVPDIYLAEPYLMPLDVQKNSGCIIGHDYPAPMVDHKIARLAALEKYRSV